jgi:putative FmdB family regulatory protein
MPIYEYVCQSCGGSLEALQRLSDAPLTRCPHCGEEALRKKVSAAAFRLSGSGWYETDFKTGGKKNLAGDKDAGKAGTGEGGKEKSGGATADGKGKADGAAKKSGGASGGGGSSAA